MKKLTRKATEKAIKFDGEKVRLELVPAEFTYAVGAVLTYGASKYDDWNWLEGLGKARMMAAIARHAGAYMLGEELDPESNLPHTWHMAACMAMLISADLRGMSVEDRVAANDAYKRAQEHFSAVRNPPKLP